jgi:hypothetical protein
MGLDLISLSQCAEPCHGTGLTREPDLGHDSVEFSFGARCDEFHRRSIPFASFMAVALAKVRCECEWCWNHARLYALEVVRRNDIYMQKGRTASCLGCDCFHFCFRGISWSSHLNLLIASLPETEGSSVAHDIQTSPGTQLPDWPEHYRLSFYIHSFHRKLGLLDGFSSSALGCPIFKEIELSALQYNFVLLPPSCPLLAFGSKQSMQVCMYVALSSTPKRYHRIFSMLVDFPQ